MPKNTTKQDEQLSMATKKETLVRLFKYMLAYKKQIVVVLLIMAITTAISIINPLLIERAINVEIAGHNVKGLIILCGIGLGMNIVFILLVKLRMYIMAKVSNSVLVTIRQELYEHIQTLGFGFFDSRPTGKILARIMGDINSLKDVLSNSVTTFIPDLVTISVVVVIMFIKNPKLALAALCTLPVMAVTIFILERINHRRWQVFRQKNSNLNAFTHEDVAGIRVIQSLAAEEETNETFKGLVGEHLESFTNACRTSDFIGPVIDINWAIGLIVMYFAAVKLMGLTSAEVGTLIAFGYFVGMFWQPVLNLSNFYNQLTTNITGAERVFEILDTEPEITDAAAIEELPDVAGSVSFDHVSFHYDNDPNVLNDVSFSVEAGKTIALVGPTGAGKTTIVNLIARFYDVQEGTIRIDGYDVKKVTIDSLRKQLGVMTQENFLFSGTIRDNIRYGRLDATDDEIEEAAKAVGVHDFIMTLEKGYDTVIKERGAGFSAGQRQLIAFARTFVSNPRLLILDEATSSIDTHTELLVQEGIEKLLKGRTSFVIAHRLSTIRKADTIMVVDHGGIMENGSHDELMKKKGEYYKLYMNTQVEA